MTMARDQVERIRDYKLRLAWLEQDARTWISHCSEVQEFALPTHGRDLDGTRQTPNDGKKKHGSIYNGAATNALLSLASAIHNNLTSPAQPWFALSLAEKDLLELEGVKPWLEDCTRRIAYMLAKSDFYGAAWTFFVETVAFGTGVMLIESPRPSRMRFTPLTFGEYFIALDQEGEINTLYRRFWMSVSQIVEKWGKENLSLSTKEMANDETKRDERVRIIHVIQPREVVQGYGATSAPWESVYFEEAETTKILGESGYRSCPFAAARWRVNSGDTYGRGPVMECLSDIRMLQKLENLSLRAVNHAVDPSLNVPYGLKRGAGVSLLPGAKNYYDGITPDSIRPTFQLSGNEINAAEMKIAQVVQRIKEFLYNDRFFAVTERDERMTATEVRARQLERLSVLAPVVQQYQGGFLTPSIERTFDVMYRHNQLPPPPPAIAGRIFTVEYIGLLAQAQKAQGASSLDAFVAYAQQFAAAQSAQGSVEVLDKIDFDQGIDEVADYVGAPARVVRSDDAVAAIRDRRAQAQQAQNTAALMQQAPGMAAAAKDLSETKVDEGKRSALDMYLGLSQ